MASIEKRSTPKGTRYLVRYRDPENKQRARTFKSYQDAKDYRTDLESDLKNKTYISQDGGKTLLSQWGTDWLDNRVDQKRKGLEAQDSLWRSQLKPALGGRRLDSLLVSDVQGWAKTMERNGLSASRIRQGVILLSQMLESAVEDRLIPRNPAALKGTTLKLPRLKAYEPELITYREVEKLVVTLPEQDGLLVLLMSYTGLRFGEATGLQVQDVDTAAGLLRVCRSLTDVGGYLQLEAPKNGKPRMIPLPGFLAERLAEHALGLGAGTQVFRAPNGGYVRYNNWRTRRWLPALNATGMQDVEIHSLRRLYIRTLGENQVAGSVLRDVAGHSSAVMTLTYSATTPEAQEQVRGVLSAVRSKAA